MQIILFKRWICNLLNLSRKTKKQFNMLCITTVPVLIQYCRFDPQTNQWSGEVAPTSSCRTSVGVAVLDSYMYAVGGQDGVSCLNFVERCVYHT